MNDISPTPTNSVEDCLRPSEDLTLNDVLDALEKRRSINPLLCNTSRAITSGGLSIQAYRHEQLYVLVLHSSSNNTKALQQAVRIRILRRQKAGLPECSPPREVWLDHYLGIVVCYFLARSLLGNFCYF